MSASRVASRSPYFCDGPNRLKGPSMVMEYTEEVECVLFAVPGSRALFFGVGGRRPSGSSACRLTCESSPRNRIVRNSRRYRSEVSPDTTTVTRVARRRMLCASATLSIILPRWKRSAMAPVSSLGSPPRSTRWTSSDEFPGERPTIPEAAFTVKP